MVATMSNKFIFMNQMTVDPSWVTGDTTVLLGFTGYGSVGTLVLNHIIEKMDVTSIGFWGSISWYHKGNLETPITIYKLNQNSKKNSENIVLVSSRIPIPVVGYDAMPDAFWRWLSHEILSWKAKRYIIIGGLREDVRSPTDDSWVALIPTPKYTELYGTKRTFRDNLSMKGPISFLLTEGTAYDYPVLAILSYCNTFDMDNDAALMALKELEKHLDIDLKSSKLEEFDTSFLEREEFEKDIEEDFEDYDEVEDYDEDFDIDERFDPFRSYKGNKDFRRYGENGDDLEKYK